MQKQVTGFVKNHKDIEEMDMPGGARIRWLITHRDGAPTFSMRLISIAKGKNTPYHQHDYEHEIYVISGSGKVTIGENLFQAKQDSFIFIPPNTYHGIVAETDMKVICVVPVSAAREILGD